MADRDLPMDHEYVNCAICGTDNFEVLIGGTDAARIVRCRNDGLIWRNPRTKAGKCREFHTHHVNANNVNWFNSARNEVLRREARAIMKIKRSGNLLDIGCATGVLFENFPQDKWHLYGVEPSALAVDLARKRGADVFCGTLAEAHYPPAFFNVVSMLDAFYYFTNPRAELEEIKRILRKDGLLALEIPGWNYLSLRERGPICWLLDRKWLRGFKNPWELYYFPPSTLKRLLESVGFRVIKVIPEQASHGKAGLSSMPINLHFALARCLFKATAGKVSISGKELYLAIKSELRGESSDP